MEIPTQSTEHPIVTTAAGQLRRTIWILWLQGFANAPFVVQKCLESWKKHNAGWQLIELDENNCGDWLDLAGIVRRSRSDVSRQALSDIIRINLLARYGGVWVDATCLCCKPLDDWLVNSLGAGFFAFEKPAPDRLLASWLVASTTDCHLTNTYRDHVNAYWRDNYFANQHTRRGEQALRHLGRLFNVNASRTRFWFSAPVLKWLRVYPYYWFHYLLAEIIRRDVSSRHIWERRVKASANDPLKLLRHPGPPLSSFLSDSLKLTIDSGRTPIWKLSWRRFPGIPLPGSALDYLFAHLGASAHHTAYHIPMQEHDRAS
jgi:Capsular polysaccharide synthesis protein